MCAIHNHGHADVATIAFILAVSSIITVDV